MQNKTTILKVHSGSTEDCVLLMCHATDVPYDQADCFMASSQLSSINEFRQSFASMENTLRDIFPMSMAGQFLLIKFLLTLMLIFTTKNSPRTV